MPKTFLIVLLALLMAACSSSTRLTPQADSPVSFQDSAYASLPELASFATQKTDQFLVDMALVARGNPYMGRRAEHPHTGAHVHFEQSGHDWPRGGTAPENYPPIYAVSDGIIARIVETFNIGKNDRYGVYLALAHEGNTLWSMDYSIEPYAPEPSPGFYAQFITVHNGERVKKGQIIAYMYLPGSDVDAAHIHFELISLNEGKMKAPAIFTPDVMRQFHDTWRDGGIDGQSAMPVCMGWMLAADENPFAEVATDCLP